MDEAASVQYNHILENFCVRTGFLALLWCVSMFLFTIGFGLLAVGVYLSQILEPMVAGVTLISILVGVVLGKIVHNKLFNLVSDFAVNIARFVIVDSDRHVPTESGGNADLLFYYFFFAVIGVGSHIGLHTYASRLITTFAIPVTKFDPSAITLYMIILFLDVGSAIGAVVIISFQISLYLRLFDILRHRFGHRIPVVLQSTTLDGQAPIWLKLVPHSVREGYGHEDDTHLLVDFSVRIGLLALFVGVLIMGTILFIRHIGPSGWEYIIGTDPIRIGTKVGILVTGIVLLYLIMCFFAGLLYSELVFFKRILDGPGRIARLRQIGRKSRSFLTSFLDKTILFLVRSDENDALALLSSGLFVLIGVALYVLSKRTVVRLINHYPPPALFSGTLRYVDVQLTLLEVADITGVTIALSFAVPMSIRLRAWLKSSPLVTGLEILSDGYANVARHFSYFSSKLSGTTDDAVNSTATNWIRITFLLQLFTVAAILQTWSIGGPWSQPLILFGVGTAGQAYAVWEDLRTRRGAKRGTIWLLAVLLVPPLGGLAYIIRVC